MVYALVIEWSMSPLVYQLIYLTIYLYFNILVVEIKDRARPVFKKHPFKSVEDDPKGAFSLILYGVLHNEHIRAYIH